MNPTYEQSLAAFDHWLETHCEADDHDADSYARLFQSWKRFAVARDVVFRDRIAFNRFIMARGFERIQGADTIRVAGLRLLEMVRSHAA